MFSHLSTEDLCMIALLLEEEDQNTTNQKTAKRVGVNPLLRKRKLEGEYWILFKELSDDEEKFFKYFRMNQEQFDTLLHKIKPLITKQNTVFRDALPPKEKLAVCLRYLATGDSYASIAYKFRLGGSTVHTIVRDVCKAIIKTMKKEYIKKVPTKEKWFKNTEDFWNIWKFPNCIGAMGGKELILNVPPSCRHKYGYCKTFSVILLAIVDAHYNFDYVEVTTLDDNSNKRFFSMTKLNNILATNSFNIPPNKNLPGTEISMPHVIIGNEGFPLRTYLMRPHPKRMSDAQKSNFNKRLIHAREVVEDAFRLLTEKFRLYNKKIHIHPKNAKEVILTTFILHNFILSSSQPSKICRVAHRLRNLSNQGGHYQGPAFEVRKVFTTFFDSPAGQFEF